MDQRVDSDSALGKQQVSLVMSGQEQSGVAHYSPLGGDEVLSHVLIMFASKVGRDEGVDVLAEERVGRMAQGDHRWTGLCDQAKILGRGRDLQGD